MSVTTETRMLRAALALMGLAILAMSIALYMQSILLAIAIVGVLSVAASTLVRCPRCKANAYREETSIGTMYSIINTKCYKCGLSFTKPYSVGTSETAGDADRVWREPTLDGSSSLVFASKGGPSGARWVARFCLGGAALLVGYANVNALFTPGATWQEVALVCVAASGLYAVWLVVVLTVLRWYRNRTRPSVAARTDGSAG